MRPAVLVGAFWAVVATIGSASAQVENVDMVVIVGEVEVRSIDIPTPFQDFEDYWTPFLRGQGPAPSYVSSLTEHERAELRDYLQAHLPTASDGSIDLIARAWAVRGLRPVDNPL